MRTQKRARFFVLLVALMLLGVSWVMAGPSAEGASATPQEIHIKGWQYWTPATVPDNPQYGDHYMFRVAEQKFGIYIDWTVVGSAGQEALGLLLASGDLPDLIGEVFGPTFAQDYGRQGAFIQLEDYIADDAPNLTRIMQQSPAIRGQTVSPDGHIYFFPRTMEALPRSWPGYQIRQDWLDKLGLEMPDTMAEFKEVLRAFRDGDPNGNGKKDEVPWTTDPRVLLWPWGIGSRGYNNSTDMFVEDGKIKFGPTDPRYKQAVTEIASWYKEGLIDPEYLGQSGSQRNALVLGNLTGAILGSYAGYLTSFNKLYAADGHSDWKWVAMPSPQGPTGIRNMMGGHKELDPGTGAAITVSSKYPAEITQMMDYFYGDEGRNVLYFGQEGVDWNMVNGVPTYTDKVTKNPQNLSIAAYMNTYVGFISVWPSLLPDQAQLALYDQEGKDGLRLSAKYETDRKIPNLQFTAEELSEVQAISRDLNTYSDEWVHGFIRGQKSVTADWTEYQNGLKRLNVERLTALYNAAYDRYKKVISGS